ncbi:MAG: hypothetical protein KC912_17650 [Proteobacteria bacterium]|nr:hypothetical protein [Pseudomonadota bacterium]
MTRLTCLMTLALLATACTEGTGTDPDDPDNTAGESTYEPVEGTTNLTNCSGTIASDAPSFFTEFWACADISNASGGVQVSTDGLPPHQSAYYATDHENYVAFDTRGGTHRVNPNTLGSQNISFTFPDDPTPKGITITDAIVDNEMMTSDEEYSGGPVGIALNGVSIFAAMAAPGDDLWEEQYTFDLYEGHPAGTTYHYHFETPGPLEVLQHKGWSTSSTPGQGDVELYGLMCDGTVVLGCTELDGSAPDDGDFDAQNGHLHDIDDGSTTHFENRYHTHVCPDEWPDYPFFPEIAYYQTTTCR